MPNQTILQWITLIVPIVIMLLGLAVTWGMYIKQKNYQQERIEKLEHIAEHLMSGGVGGATVFVPRGDCEELREHCRTEILGAVTKHSEVMASHTRCIRALENFVRWFLTSKEGLPLSEVNKILNGNGEK